MRFLYRTRGISEMAAGDSQPQPDPEKMPKPHISKHLRRQVWGKMCETFARQPCFALFKPPAHSHCYGIPIVTKLKCPYPE